MLLLSSSTRLILRSVPWLACGALTAPAPSHALQPLSAFIESAPKHNPDLAEASSGLEAQKAQADVNLGRALPNVTARGVYTRNQYQIPIGPIPGIIEQQVFLQRFNQVDAFFTLNVPLVDLGSFDRIGAANLGTDAAAQQLHATSLQVSAAVAQDFFQLIANQALVAASERALDVAKTNLRLTQTRYQLGSGAVLEVDRARAEVERQTQLLASANLQVALAARALESASGLSPNLSGTVPLADDLHEEPPLETFQSPDAQLPSVAAAALSRASAERQARSQRLTLVPALSGAATEHGTNATSFSGQPWSYTAMLALNWQLDYTTFASIRAQDASVGAARAREQRAQLLARDGIHRAWATVGAAIARSRSARTEQQASSHASQLAQERYEVGAATQLDVLQAERDAFSADVSRIQADADLANARIQLRLAAGTSPFASKGSP